MPISSVCANGHTFQVRDDLLGKKVKCPTCSAVTTVGAGPAGAAPKSAPPKKGAKGKAAGDPWEMEDRFDDEEGGATEKRAPVKPKAKPSAGAGGSRKKRSKSSGGSSSLGLILGVVGGVAVIGGGVWFLLGRSPGPAASGETVAAVSTAPGAAPSAAASPMPAANATPAVPAPPPSALALEVAALPYPPMTDPRYGPPPPAGLVVSRAILNATTEMLLTAMRADGKPGPLPHQMVENGVMVVGKQRAEDPLLFCLAPDLDAALLAGTADIGALRRDFDAALAAMEPAGAKLPAVVTAYLPAYKKNELSGGMTAFLTGMLQAKLRKEQSAAAKPAGQ